MESVNAELATGEVSLDAVFQRGKLNGKFVGRENMMADANIGRNSGEDGLGCKVVAELVGFSGGCYRQERAEACKSEAVAGFWK